MQGLDAPRADLYPFSVNAPHLQIGAYSALGFFLRVWYIISNSVCFVAEVAGDHNEVKLSYLYSLSKLWKRA